MRHNASPDTNASHEPAEIREIRSWAGSGLLATVDVDVHLSTGGRLQPSDLPEVIEQYLSSLDTGGVSAPRALEALTEIHRAIKPMIEQEAA